MTDRLGPMPLDDDTPLDVVDVEDDDFTDVTHYDPKIKARAYDLYLNSSMGPQEIAIDLNLHTHVVVAWIRNGKWKDRKQEVEMELFRGAEDQYRNVIRKHRVPTVERHLRIAKKLEEGIEKVVDHETNDPDRAPGDMVLKRMAEALSSVTGVSARAAAISDKPFMEDQEREQKGKQPLVVVGVQVSKSGDVSVSAKDD